MFNAFLHTHEGSWVVLALLFVISYFTRQNVTLMLQRLFYLVMIVTGGYLLYQLQFPGIYILKAVLAIVLIGIMEMMIARKRKGQGMPAMFLLVIILIVVIVLIGYGKIHF
ncbi:hypothetical protein A374_17094 [Fictibacillus macauensis ZFHKF-1]|uniref:Uncharacterized protein n=1 Tax=Fictibacillus macauensis ZFHKF-1 TaxID=1196324 RepID=I8AEU3_9BACL|nr:YisL family protein [Fictibacillus macauensis]EIT84117.1 hypothetical protein A374_17094 [Fictibacillus macauensis ZFHKF-1]